MKIAIVLEYFFDTTRPVGGAERQLEKLARALIHQGQTVTILTGAWAGQTASNVLTADLPVRRLFAGGSAFNRRGLRKFAQYIFLISLFIHLFLHRRRYDVIHCHSLMTSAYVAGLVGTFLKKPTLARAMASGSQWGDIARMKGPRHLFGSQWMISKLHRIDLIVALNNDVVEELSEIGVKRSKIIHIPNGVEVDPTFAKFDYTLNDPILVTFIGRLHPQKAADVLITALPQVIAMTRGTRWKLQIVGDGPLKESLQSQVEQLGLQSSVAFFGQVSDVERILRASDIFVLPSRAEGMSNALLEAMSIGLPLRGFEHSCKRSAHRP
jgi:glycosyltransferase involved in cell wall biosynthesis